MSSQTYCQIAQYIDSMWTTIFKCTQEDVGHEYALMLLYVLSRRTYGTSPLVFSLLQPGTCLLPELTCIHFHHLTCSPISAEENHSHSIIILAFQLHWAFCLSGKKFRFGLNWSKQLLPHIQRIAALSTDSPTCTVFQLTSPKLFSWTVMTCGLYI